jgi:serine protease Do
MGTNTQSALRTSPAFSNQRQPPHVLAGRGCTAQSEIKEAKAMFDPHMERLRGVFNRMRGSRFANVRSGIAGAAIAMALALAVPVFAAESASNASPPGGNLTPQAAQAAPVLPNFVSLVKTVKPAVVSVRVRAEVSPQVLSEGGGLVPFEGTPFEWFFNQRPGQQGEQHNAPRQYSRILGSGFLISADGYIVTNNHVIEHADKVEVVADDGTTYGAKVVGADKKTDLALLKVDGRSDFPFVKFGDKKPSIGEWVVAMGNPFGLGGTVTAGIVSAQGRNIGSGPYDDYLQIDAAVNRGNSGGPTFNMSGRVIGVNTAIYSPSGGNVGIAFDIPASTASWVVAQLKEHGSVQRSWLGVKVQAVNKAIAEGLGLTKPEGVLIAQAQPNSPASKAGLKAGDVIISVDGAQVKNPRDLARRIATAAPNSAVDIAYIRNGSMQNVQATLAKMHEAPTSKLAAHQDHQDRTGRLGMTVAPAAEIEGAGNSGLAVLQVDPEGKAAELGLAAGDVMVKAGNQQLGNVDDLNHAIESAASKGRSSLLLLVRRGDAQRYVAMPVATG